MQPRIPKRRKGEGGAGDDDGKREREEWIYEPICEPDLVLEERGGDRRGEDEEDHQTQTSPNRHGRPRPEMPEIRSATRTIPSPMCGDGAQIMAAYDPLDGPVIRWAH